MIEYEFGKLLEKLIYFSSQKNYSLAITLGYDVSYISKWINSSTLPTSKNIKVINQKISDFIVSSCDESELENIINYLHINITEIDDIPTLLKNTIEDELNKAYLYSYNKNRKKEIKEAGNYNNSIQTTQSSFIKKYVSDEIATFTREASKLEIILLCNLSKLTNEDKVKIAGVEILKNEQNRKKKNNMVFTYLLSFDENAKDILFDAPLFIHMATSKKRIKSVFYSGDYPTNTFISVVKNKCTHTVLYDNNNKRLMSVTSTDSKSVDEMYDMLNNMIYTQSRPTFLKMAPEEIILSHDKVSYIINSELKILACEMTELFMPSDLFLEIGEKIFESNEDVLLNLKKIDTIFQEFTYNSKLDIVLYEDMFRNYIYNGHITFFNKKITLTMEQRKRHIEYMKTILEEKDNISLNLAHGSLLDDYKEEEKIFLSISKDNTFLKEKDNGISQNYLIVKDIKLEMLLKSFFKGIWNENNKKNDKNRILNIIDDSIRYIEIFN